jgi:hypothetical protein
MDGSHHVEFDFLGGGRCSVALSLRMFCEASFKLFIFDAASVSVGA